MHRQKLRPETTSMETALTIDPKPSDVFDNTQLGQTKILVVDDNYPSAMTLTWAMEANGHEVHTCHNGQEAVEEARAFHPDVVLLDIEMPVMDGLEACRAMRAEPGMDAVLIIAQTAWGDSGAKAATAAAGFNFHLVKPVSLDEVEKLVSSRVRKQDQ